MAPVRAVGPALPGVVLLGCVRPYEHDVTIYHHAHKMTKEIESSNRINGVGAYDPAADPSGGFKNSGTGREEAIDDLLSYTKEKAINIMI